MPTLTSLLKRTCPQRLQRLIHDKVYKYLGLGYHLDSGVQISVESKTDWLVYNDVFLNCEYDAAIFPLRAHPPASATILDLGCNTGFFILRCLDVLGRESFENKFRWFCVDGSADTLLLFQARVLKTNKLEGQVDAIHGLVGQRTGEEAFYESTNHGNNTRKAQTLVHERRYTKNIVKFIDLDSIIPSGPISLIKCDIEGSEVDFIKNYGDLCTRAESLVFEFHQGHYDRSELIGKVKAFGFAHRTLRERPGTSLEYFFH